MLRLNDILDMVSAYNPGANLDTIKKAYVFAAKVHQGQTRLSGEPYLVHPMEVAGILAEMRLDVASIVTAFLHDTVEDTVTTLEEIEQIFGEEIRNLVDGITKLSRIKFTTSEQKQAENFRKMIMAMARDIRVILIKLADRLHNMRTLEHMTEVKRVEIAQETMDVYAPIANRLGIQKIKVELEDLAFKYLKPDVYKLIEEKVTARRSKRDKYIEEVKDIVRKKVGEQNIKCDIQGRVKHFFSIHRKMEAQNIPFDEVYDLIAFRIVVDTIQQCYEVLGVLHSLWRPVPGRFKDYIAMPKANNYQSLHTTAIGPYGERAEFQIRTREMHEIGERGIAAHWKYKEGKIFDEKDEMKFKWIRQLLEWHLKLSDPAEFLDTVKLDLFADDVYVFTPKGELIELPRGSTPVDFAYSIHSEIGNNCIGGKVNGKIVPLKYVLHSGDTVEIITQKGRKPNKDWLQFVKTSRAKTKIRQFTREEEHEHGLAIGREVFEKECDKYGLNHSKLLKGSEMGNFLKETHYKDSEAVLVAIGYGKLSAHQFLTNLVPRDQLVEKGKPKETIISKLVGKLTRRQKGLVKVSGVSDILVSFGKCCNPIPGDSIIGYVTQGRGVSVHVRNCQKMLAADPDRLVPVEWDLSDGIGREVKIKVVCVDKPGLLAALTEAITKQGVNITEAQVRTMVEDKRAINIFEVEIKNVEELRHTMQAIERVKGVISVERIKS